MIPKSRRDLTVVDLFCGSGAVTIGLKLCGFNVVYTVIYDHTSSKLIRQSLIYIFSNPAKSEDSPPKTDETDKTHSTSKTTMHLKKIAPTIQAHLIKVEQHIKRAPTRDKTTPRRKTRQHQRLALEIHLTHKQKFGKHQTGKTTLSEINNYRYRSKDSSLLQNRSTKVRFFGNLRNSYMVPWLRNAVDRGLKW